MLANKTCTTLQHAIIKKIKFLLSTYTFENKLHPRCLEETNLDVYISEYRSWCTHCSQYGYKALIANNKHIFAQSKMNIYIYPPTKWHIVNSLIKQRC